MRFCTNSAIRHCYRYVYILIAVGLPIWFSTFPNVVIEKERTGYVALCWGISLFNTMVIQFVFWEKFFAYLILTEDEIRWKCPLRKTKVIPTEHCVEIGAYLENANNGIPSEQIYFSDHYHPQKGVNKNGVMKSSKHLIKFAYNEQLCKYIIDNYPSEITNCLLEYQKNR